MKKILKIVTAVGLTMILRTKKRHDRPQSDITISTKHASYGHKWRFIVGSVLLGTTVMTAPAYAMSESAVQRFASHLNSAANAQNIGMVSRVIDDNAVISLTRKGSTITLDKNGYLQLLQKSWAGASDYRYDIHITDIVITGNQARANVITTESWMKDGRRITFKARSRATLSYVGGNAMLLRAVSHVTVE